MKGLIPDQTIDWLDVSVNNVQTMDELDGQHQLREPRVQVRQIKFVSIYNLL
jgi:hypothetical protein